MASKIKSFSIFRHTYSSAKATKSCRPNESKPEHTQKNFPDYSYLDKAAISAEPTLKIHGGLTFKLAEFRPPSPNKVQRYSPYLRRCTFTKILHINCYHRKHGRKTVIGRMGVPFLTPSFTTWGVAMCDATCDKLCSKYASRWSV